MNKGKFQVAEFLSRQGAWITLALVILLVLLVRVRLREMPLERDEGEYAYAGQLMLQGIPPYKLAYNMKLPGTYAAYALIMAVFGETDSGIHIGLALVNIGTIIMVFFLGRRLLDPITGAVGALAYGLLSTSSAFMGLAAHATHFVVLCAVPGGLLLLRAVEERKSWQFFTSGLLFGLAFLMKQHGMFFGFFGIGYIISLRLRDVILETSERRNPKARRSIFVRFDYTRCGREAGLVLAGFLLPFLLTCAVLAMAGVFKPFWFWTFTYAREYATAINVTQLHGLLTAAMEASVGLNAIFWVLATLGAVMVWWEERLRAKLLFLVGFLVAGVLALCAGMYFRHHYFILLLPVVALLNGVVVSRAIHLIRHEKSVELFLALGGLVLFGLAVLVGVAMNGEDWFGTKPEEVSKRVYGSSIFCNTRDIARELEASSPANASLVVLGSEPEIYFYARRLSTSGYVYVYALMESHPYAAKMQDEMIREIEGTKPDYVVFITDPLSWFHIKRGESSSRILSWWENYWGKHYELLKTVNISLTSDDSATTDVEKSEQSPKNAGYLLLLKRKAENVSKP